MITLDNHEHRVRGEQPVDGGKAAVMPRGEMVLGPPLPPRPMFADSVLDFGGQSKRKAMATTTSFIVNCLAICMMLLVPLMFTEELPKGQLLTMLIAPPPPPPLPPPAAEAVREIVKEIQTDMLNTGQLRPPTRIPQKDQLIKEEEAP